MSALPQKSNIWEFSGAQEKLGEVMDRAINEGPQEIHRGDDVVMISIAEFEKITEESKHPTFIDHLLAFPKEEPGEPSLTEIIREGRRYFDDCDQ